MYQKSLYRPDGLLLSNSLSSASPAVWCFSLSPSSASSFVFVFLVFSLSPSPSLFLPHLLCFSLCRHLSSFSWFYRAFLYSSALSSSLSLSLSGSSIYTVSILHFTFQYIHVGSLSRPIQVRCLVSLYQHFIIKISISSSYVLRYLFYFDVFVFYTIRIERWAEIYRQSRTQHSKYCL